MKTYKFIRIIALIVASFSLSVINAAEKKTPHYYVDLGLQSGTLWATCNIGASNPWNYGTYFQWGNVTPSTKYTDEESKLYNDSVYYICGDKKYDPAIYNWGSNWCLPTEIQMSELRFCCKWKWTTMHGVKGILGTGPNGKTIFFPAGGFRCDFFGKLETLMKEESGSYWTGAQSDLTGAMHLSFDYDNPMGAGWELSVDVQPANKGAGCLVRPVVNR